MSKSDKLERLSNPDERADLKNATRRALRAVKGNKFALVTRVEPEALSNYGSIGPDNTDKFMPVDVLLDLQHEYGRGVASPLLETLAELAGFRLVPIEDDGASADDSDGGVSVNCVSTLIKENGETEAAALAALNSNCIVTIDRGLEEAGQSYRATAHLKARLRSQRRAVLRRAS